MIVFTVIGTDIWSTVKAVISFPPKEPNYLHLLANSH